MYEPMNKNRMELVLRGVDCPLAANTAASKRGPWRVANSPALYFALPNAYFDSLGIPRLTDSAPLNSPNRRMRTRMSGGVPMGRGGPPIEMKMCTIEPAQSG
jgi:hypothetical protein